MFGRRHRTRVATQKPAPEWSRQKMVALLLGTGVCALVLVVGLVLAVAYYLRPAPTSHRVTGRSTNSHTDNTMRVAAGAPDPRDALAVRVMPHVDEDASHPGTVSTSNPGAALEVPRTTSIGPAGVPSGFPHTPAGALAQLAAIDQVAMQSLSLVTARQVIETWAVTGGPNAESWSVVQALAQLFGQLGVSSGSSHQLALVLTPVMGLIKGTVGPDYVVPCLDFEMDLTLTRTARGAIADCQRMVWQPDPTQPTGGRWLIGAGPEASTPPSVWPDTDLAFAVGYRDLRPEE